MKNKAVTLGIVFMLAASVSFAACKKENEHTHSFGEWNVVREASCTETGERKRSCACGYGETDTIPATGHRAEHYEKGDAENHWKLCVVCGEAFGLQAHAFNEGTCSVCGKAEEIPVVFSYKLNAAEDGYIVTGIAGGNVFGEIPSTYLGLPVTEIGANAFEKAELSEIVFPDSVVKIGNYAFSECYGLKKITFGKNLDSIGEYAFYGAAVEDLFLPESLTKIETCAFAKTERLKSIEIPKQAKLVGNTFWKSGVERVKINGSTTGWGIYGNSYQVFLNCDKLKVAVFGAEASGSAYHAFNESISLTDYVSDNNPNYTAEGGILYDGNGTKAIKCAPGREGSVTVKEGVTEIASYAFKGCKKLKGVSLPQSLTLIGELAFNGAGITEIEIPDGVTEINKNAFLNCGSLTTMRIGKGLEFFYYENAIKGCSLLQTIIVSEENTWYRATNGSLVYFGGTIAYGKNKLVRVNSAGEIPDYVNHISNYSFIECVDVEEIVIPASVKTIDMKTFVSCAKLKKVTFENTAGWTVTENGATYPTDAIAVDVTNPQSNAERLLATYSNYIWMRSDN